MGVRIGISVGGLSVGLSWFLALGAATAQPADYWEDRVSRIELPAGGRDEAMAYWLRLPAGYAPGQRPALLIGLHGTDDTAREMLDFTAALPAPVPLMIVAPESMGRGWGSEDIPAIQAVLADVSNRYPHDARRVLLIGFSAGGAMSLQLVYGEQFAVTAVAALAGYVPPQLTAEQIRLRRDVPVFFAVGTQDLNHELMREGVARLRIAGSDVRVHRPRIGHVLDEQVAEAALGWFFDRCAALIRAEITTAAGDADLAQSCLILEAIIAQARWHEPALVDAARRALETVKTSGQERLHNADQLVRQGREVDAVDLLRKIEADYGSSRMGSEARDRRLALERRPAVSSRLAQRQDRQHTERALHLYLEVRELMYQRRFTAAAERCRQLLDGFENTPWADSARNLLENLQGRTSVE